MKPERAKPVCSSCGDPWPTTGPCDWCSGARTDLKYRRSDRFTSPDMHGNRHARQVRPFDRRSYREYEENY